MKIFVSHNNEISFLFHWKEWFTDNKPTLYNVHFSYLCGLQLIFHVEQIKRNLNDHASEFFLLFLGSTIWYTLVRGMYQQCKQFPNKPKEGTLRFIKRRIFIPKILFRKCVRHLLWRPYNLQLYDLCIHRTNSDAMIWRLQSVEFDYIQMFSQIEILAKLNQT